MAEKSIPQILEEIGTLLEIKGENPFKSRAYYILPHLAAPPIELQVDGHPVFGRSLLVTPPALEDRRVGSRGARGLLRDAGRGSAGSGSGSDGSRGAAR